MEPCPASRVPFLVPNCYFSYTVVRQHFLRRASSISCTLLEWCQETNSICTPNNKPKWMEPCAASRVPFLVPNCFSSYTVALQHFLRRGSSISCTFLEWCQETNSFCTPNNKPKWMEPCPASRVPFLVPNCYSSYTVALQHFLRRGSSISCTFLEWCQETTLFVLPTINQSGWRTARHLGTLSWSFFVILPTP